MTAQKEVALAGAAETISFDGEIIAEVRKNQSEVYRVTRREFKGHPLADVRVWFDDATTGELRPGKGVCIQVEVLPAIVEALTKIAERRAR